MNQAIRVALRQETPNQTLEVLLELLGKTMEADRTYIFEKMIMAMMIIHMSGQPEA